MGNGEKMWKCKSSLNCVNQQSNGQTIVHKAQWGHAKVHPIRAATLRAKERKPVKERGDARTQRAVQKTGLLSEVVEALSGKIYGLRGWGLVFPQSGPMVRPVFRMKVGVHFW